MADIVPSLFGLTPGMYQQAQQQRGDEMALQYAKLDPFQQANYAIGRGAYGLAGAAGGLLGGQDPELQRITARQQIASQIDFTNPKSIQEGMNLLGDDIMGKQQLAAIYRQQLESGALIGQRQAEATASLAQAGRERVQATPKEIQIAREVALLSGPEGSPEYIAAYGASLRGAEKTDKPVVVGNALVNPNTGTVIYQSPNEKLDTVVVGGNLVDKATGRVIFTAPETQAKPVVVDNKLVNPIDGTVIYQGEKPEKYSAFAQELIDAGLTPNTPPFQKRMLEYVSEKSKGAGKGTGNVNIGGISLNTGEAGKAAGKVIGTNVANVEQQYSLNTAFKDALMLLDQGIYGGAYGPEKQFVAKYAGVGDPKKVVNTEVFMANIGEIVIPRLQQFGGNDSNEELKYLQKVVAGDQRLEPAAMKQILASAEKKVQKNLARLQQQAEAGKTGGELPIGPVNPAKSSTPTKRYNPKTGKIEAISGE